MSEGELLACGRVGGELLLADLLRQVGPVAIEASEAVGAGIAALIQVGFVGKRPSPPGGRPRGGYRGFLARRSSRTRRLELQPVKAQDKKPDSRRQVGMSALSIDRRHQLRQPHVASNSDLPEGLPEVVFEANAGFMTRDHDRSLEDPRPLLIAWRGPASVRCRRRCYIRHDLPVQSSSKRLSSRPPTTDDANEQLPIVQLVLQTPSAQT